VASIQGCFKDVADKNFVHGYQPADVEQLQEELTRLKTIFPIAQQQKLAAELEATLAEETLKESKLQDERYEQYFGQFAADMPTENIRLKTRDVQAEIEECQAQRSHLMEKLIPPLLERLGELQETTVLEGDFDFKAARQDYYLSKQQRMLEHLAFQQARHVFLLATIQAETTMLNKTHNIVSATIADMVEYQQEMDSRQEEVDHLAQMQAVDQRQTVDTRDTFTQRLNHMLGGSAQGEAALAPASFTLSSVNDWKNKAGALQEKRNAMQTHRQGTIKTLEELVKGFEAQVFPEAQAAEEKMASKEFHSLSASLAQHSEDLAAHITRLRHQIDVDAE